MVSYSAEIHMHVTLCLSTTNRFHLKGPHAGEMMTFAENLPGMPSKISRSSRNGFWVGFTLSRLNGNKLENFYWDALSRTVFFNVRRFPCYQTYFLQQCNTWAHNNTHKYTHSYTIHHSFHVINTHTDAIHPFLDIYALALYPGLWREGLVHTVSRMHVMKFKLIMQSSKMVFGFESDVSHLQLAKGIGDTVRETWAAGMRHSRRCSFAVYGIQT